MRWKITSASTCGGPRQVQVVLGSGTQRTAADVRSHTHLVGNNQDVVDADHGHDCDGRLDKYLDHPPQLRAADRQVLRAVPRAPALVPLSSTVVRVRQHEDCLLSLDLVARTPGSSPSRHSRARHLDILALRIDNTPRWALTAHGSAIWRGDPRSLRVTSQRLKSLQCSKHASATAQPPRRVSSLRAVVNGFSWLKDALRHCGAARLDGPRSGILGVPLHTSKFWREALAVRGAWAGVGGVSSTIVRRWILLVRALPARGQKRWHALLFGFNRA